SLRARPARSFRMTSRGGALRKKREVIAWFLFFVSRSGGGTRGGMSDEQRQRMHQTMQLVFEAPPALTIAETDSSVAVRSDTGADPVSLRTAPAVSAP